MEIQSGYKSMVAVLYTQNCSMDGEVDMANARLIAAAPELLEALKETREVAAACFRAMVELGCVDAVLAQLPPGLTERTEGFGNRAGDAIAKAEGRA